MKQLEEVFSILLESFVLRGRFWRVLNFLMNIFLSVTRGNVLRQDIPDLMKIFKNNLIFILNLKSIFPEENALKFPSINKI